MFDLWEEIANIWQIANISPMMDFFHKILLSEEVSNKMNIFGFIFEKKNQVLYKNPKISFRQFKLTLAA